jgi:riboflavin biosynthesis pyrimidine reductase
VTAPSQVQVRPVWPHAGVVDEVRMLVCPAARGRGRRVFEDRRDLALVEATAFENGVALLRYGITK